MNFMVAGAVYPRASLRTGRARAECGDAGAAVPGRCGGAAAWGRHQRRHRTEMALRNGRPPAGEELCYLIAGKTSWSTGKVFVLVDLKYQ